MLWPPVRANVEDVDTPEALEGLAGLEALLCAWSDAEARGDALALEPLLAADFRGDGPLGFVLDRDAWLDRHRTGDLAIDRFAWTPDEVRVEGQTAIAIGVTSQVARYRGNAVSGAFICTLVVVRSAGLWRIVNLQIGRGAARKSSTQHTSNTKENQS